MAAIAQGVSMIAAASVKNAGARPSSGSRSVARCASTRRSAEASMAATLMPWPCTGLNRQIASPISSRPRGKSGKRS